MEYLYAVAGTTVKIEYNNQYITQYLDREFSLMRCDRGTPSIIVKINNGSSVSIKRFKNQVRKLELIDNKIVQFFKAFQRHFGVEYRFEGNTIVCELFIPYSERGGLKKFMSSFYEGALYSCLADFFHNPFLAVLQYQLLNKGASLFHCSSFYLEQESRTIVLAGGAGSGKSTLMTELLKLVHANVCSEDFAVVTEDGRIFGYPHQTRVRFTDMGKARIRYKNGIKYGLNGVLDIINQYVYSIIQHKENGRHFSLNEIYGENGFQMKCSMGGEIYFLRRDVERPERRVLNLEDYCSIQTGVILSEFENMISAMELIKGLAELGGNIVIYDTFRDMIMNVYTKSFSSLKCIQVNIPYMPNLDDTTNELYRIIFKH